MSPATLLHKFKRCDTQRTSKEIDDIARGINPSDGWEGDAPEREWAEAMLYVLTQKSQSFSKPGYRLFPTNWLLIYDNWPVPVELPEAATRLTELLKEPGVQPSFHRVFVESDKTICDFHGLSYSAQPMRELWR